MRDQYIFDIPVYRTTKDDFDLEIERQLAKRIDWIKSSLPSGASLSREVQDREFHSVIADSGGPWEFNQVVGWLRIFAEGHTIGCHQWWVDAKRLNRRMRNKRLYLTTYSDVLGAWFPRETSAEIFDTLLDRLMKIAVGRRYKNRYVDLDVFRRVGPFIDWRGLLDGLVVHPVH